MILLSYVNTKLRDEYAALSDLCGDLGLSESALCHRLAAVGYTYDRTHNRFI
ncbi:MAG: DUF4250 domain-containing protein [Eubacteriales bacterium]|nr:DUF4250 domain-containing protein [Eubacteriales bacterium]